MFGQTAPMPPERPRQDLGLLTCLLAGLLGLSLTMTWFRNNDFDQVHSVKLEGRHVIALFLVFVVGGSLAGFLCRGVASLIGRVVAVAASALTVLVVVAMMLEPFDGSVQEVEYLTGAWLGSALAVLLLASAIVALVAPAPATKARSGRFVVEA